MQERPIGRLRKTAINQATKNLFAATTLKQKQYALEGLLYQLRLVQEFDINPGLAFPQG